MAYQHGIYSTEIETSLQAMTQIKSGLIVAVGTAPIHLAEEPAQSNVPVLCYQYKEAVKKLGYSNDFEKYTLCEVMQTHFELFNMTPIILINVLDKNKHKKSIVKTEIVVKGSEVTLEAAINLDTLKVYGKTMQTITIPGETDGSEDDDENNEGGDGTTRETQIMEVELVKNEEYVAAYDNAGKLIITLTEIGLRKAVGNKISVSYDEIDASLVTADDIVGGENTLTNESEGLELIEDIFPKFGLIPGTIISPKFSKNSLVAAMMKAKTKNIDGHFQAMAIADIPTDEVKSYTNAVEYKKRKNLVDSHMIVTYPKVSIGGKQYHLSTQLASLMNQVDAANEDIPYVSPSNKSLQCDSSVLEDGTEIYLNTASAAYLNGQGIVTALNFNGWKAWGNRTSVYPDTTDVKDSFIAVRRSFNWIANTLITSYWSKIDNPMNKRLISTVLNSANIWLNGLMARGVIWGGRIEFLSEENPTTDMIDGLLHFHVYIAPPPPCRAITFIQEYAVGYLTNLFT